MSAMRLAGVSQLGAALARRWGAPSPLHGDFTTRAFMASAISHEGKRKPLASVVGATQRAVESSELSDSEGGRTGPEDLGVVVSSSRQYVVEHMGLLKARFPRTRFVETRLEVSSTAIAKGRPVVCCFVNDDLSEPVLRRLARGGTKLIAMRCAGYDRVDVHAAAALGMRVVRVPTYSPRAVAEHAVGLMLSLNRRIHKAYVRTREGNFSLNGLVGFNMSESTVGVVGTGAIGAALCQILKAGFQCRVLAYDIQPRDDLKAIGVEYLPMDDVLTRSDIVSLHVPLLKSTERIINRDAISRMERGVMIINVSRGGLIDTDAVLWGLESGQVGSLGLDVFEHEENLFFEDWSVSDNRRLQSWDRRLTLLTSLPNCIVTPHSAFLTRQALQNIAKTTVDNIAEWVEAGSATPAKPLTNEVLPRG